MMILLRSSCDRIPVYQHVATDLAKAEARMEERPPGVDYATTKDDPSKTDYPHATETPNPAGDQAQGKSERSLAGCCVLRGYATHI